MAAEREGSGQDSAEEGDLDVRNQGGNWPPCGCSIHKVNRTETDHIKSKPVLILGFRKPF